MKTTALTDKSRILEDAGHAYVFDRMVYFNPKTRKVFSLEFVEDRPAAELRERVGENTQHGEWRFYFNSPPSEAVKRELASLLG